MTARKTDTEDFLKDGFTPDNPPPGYIWTEKHQRFMKKPSGRPKKQRSRLQETAELTAQKIVAANEMTQEEMIQEGHSAAHGRYKTREQSLENKSSLLAMVYKLQIRGLSEIQIAQQLQITEMRVKQLIAEVHGLTKLDPKKLDVGYYMGESLSFFQEIRQMALMITAGEHSPGTKMAAMRVALEAESHKNQFLTKIGVYAPSVLQTVERWIVGTATAVAEPPVNQERVNLAQAAGRALASRAARARSGLDVEDATILPSSAQPT